MAEDQRNSEPNETHGTSFISINMESFTNASDDPNTFLLHDFMFGVEDGNECKRRIILDPENGIAEEYIITCDDVIRARTFRKIKKIRNPYKSLGLVDGRRKWKRFPSKPKRNDTPETPVINADGEVTDFKWRTPEKIEDE